MKNYTFLKSLWPCHFKYAKTFSKILDNRFFAKKNCNFFRKTCAIRFLMSKAFQKSKFYQNLTGGSGSKQRLT